MAENYREPEIIFEGWTAPEGTGIIVTGAASGIGAATAILAAQRLRGIGNGCMRQPLQPLDKTELEVFRKQLEPFF